MKKLKAIGVAICICMALVQVAAAKGKYDGSVPLLCAPIEIIECGAEGDFVSATAEAVNIPQFFRINVKKKMVSATGESERKVAIKDLEHNDGKMIIHGGQGGRGWTMVISEETGKLSASVAGEQFGFLVFGACTPL